MFIPRILIPLFVTYLVIYITHDVGRREITFSVISVSSLLINRKVLETTRITKLYLFWHSSLFQCPHQKGIDKISINKNKYSPRFLILKMKSLNQGFVGSRNQFLRSEVRNIK